MSAKVEFNLSPSERAGGRAGELGAQRDARRPATSALWPRIDPTAKRSVQFKTLCLHWPLPRRRGCSAPVALSSGRCEPIEPADDLFKLLGAPVCCARPLIAIWSLARACKWWPKEAESKLRARCRCQAHFGCSATFSGRALVGAQSAGEEERVQFAQTHTRTQRASRSQCSRGDALIQFASLPKVQLAGWLAGWLACIWPDEWQAKPSTRRTSGSFGWEIVEKGRLMASSVCSSSGARPTRPH